MLFPVLPRARDSTIRRAMLVTERLHEVLTSPEGDEEWERRVAELQADLEVFVEARTMDPKYLFLLYPAEMPSGRFEARGATHQFECLACSLGETYLWQLIMRLGKN